jgi:NAD(P)-dependent dehydrogenase (short-subunit alcohol dehydrogenase family)
MTTFKPLEGRTAIVTGASSGIGRAIAEHLADAGAHILLSGRTASSMEDRKNNINGQLEQDQFQSMVALFSDLLSTPGGAAYWKKNSSKFSSAVHACIDASA